MRQGHLSRYEREVIEVHLRRGDSIRMIARQLKRAASSISREVRRNRSAEGCYCARHAQACVQQRRRVAPRPTRWANPDLRAYVQACLERKWSPEQIAHTLPEGTGRISVQTLYTWIRREGRRWTQHLRHHRNWGRPSYRQPTKYQRIRNFKRIEERPAIVEERLRIGDWESDTLRGADRRCGLATHVDRKTRYVVLAWLPDRTARTYNRATAFALGRAGVPVNTFTVDHGMEFSHHAALEARTGAAVYFANPHAAWQRGTNENTNGLLRQYFPKDRDFSTITQEELLWVEAELNARPRKTLAYRSPADLMRDSVAFQD